MIQVRIMGFFYCTLGISHKNVFKKPQNQPPKNKTLQIKKMQYCFLGEEDRHTLQKENFLGFWSAFSMNLPLPSELWLLNSISIYLSFIMEIKILANWHHSIVSDLFSSYHVGHMRQQNVVVEDTALETDHLV